MPHLNLVPRDTVLADDHPVVVAVRRLGSNPIVVEQPVLRPQLVSFSDYFERIED